MRTGYLPHLEKHRDGNIWYSARRERTRWYERRIPLVSASHMPSLERQVETVIHSSPAIYPGPLRSLLLQHYRFSEGENLTPRLLVSGHGLPWSKATDPFL